MCVIMCGTGTMDKLEAGYLIFDIRPGRRFCLIWMRYLIWPSSLLLPGLTIPYRMVHLNNVCVIMLFYYAEQNVLSFVSYMRVCPDCVHTCMSMSVRYPLSTCIPYMVIQSVIVTGPCATHQNHASDYHIQSTSAKHDNGQTQTHAYGHNLDRHTCMRQRTRAYEHNLIWTDMHVYETNDNNPSPC